LFKLKILDQFLSEFNLQN